MAQNLAKPGGARKWNTNEAVASADMIKAGTIAEQSFWDGFVARLFGGAPGGFLGADCLGAKGAGDLDYTVEAGMGIIPLTGGDFDPDYTPLYVDVQQTGTADAHDGANPRIDILSLAPLDVDDVSSSVKIKSGGAINPQTLTTRRRRSFALVYTAGTPAGSPSAPATPAGHLPVAELAVPAAAGPLVATDTRVLIGTVADGIAAGAVTPAKLSEQTTWLKLTSLGAEAGNIRSAAFQLTDQNGDAVARVQQVVVAVYTDAGDVNTAVATADGFTSNPGTQLSNGGATAAGRIIAATDGTGNFIIDVEDQTAALVGALWLHVQPVSDNGSVMEAGEATVLSVSFT